MCICTFASAKGHQKGCNVLSQCLVVSFICNGFFCKCASIWQCVVSVHLFCYVLSRLILLPCSCTPHQSCTPHHLQILERCLQMKQHQDPKVQAQSLSLYRSQSFQCPCSFVSFDMCVCLALAIIVFVWYVIVSLPDETLECIEDCG